MMPPYSCRTSDEKEQRISQEPRRTHLLRAGEEAGHVDEGDDGDVERVAEAHKAGALDARVDVQAASQLLRLVRCARKPQNRRAMASETETDGERRKQHSART